MRSFFQDFYRFLLRTQAAYGVALALVVILNAPMSLGRGESILIPGIAALAALGFGALVLIPRAAPPWLSYPNRPGHLIPMLSCLVLAPLVMSFLALAAVFSLGLPDPMPRNAAVLACLPSMALCALLWLVTPVLCLWRVNANPRNKPRRVVVAIPAE